ncbi:hypothetical protein TWF694_010019 [Orbilia ellipsospora]|uniref:BTB domain-containing protein n=1 Tax=Orbilia ellipsospora TaxID=2528407 RepID=A0AAV9X8M2_9PEZI
MNFNAPLYIRGNTDITLLIGPDETRFEANCNILASQSKFFATACYDDRFKEAKEKTIRLPELYYLQTIGVLKWLYRADPEIRDDFMDIGPTNDILEILKAADFLQVTGLVNDYSRALETKLRNIHPLNGDQIISCVKLIHRIYEIGGSIGREELRMFVQHLNKGSQKYGNIRYLGNGFAYIEEPNGRFFKDFVYAVMANL